MMRPARRLLALWLALLLAGCAGAGSPAPEGVAPGARPDAPQVMVLLAPAPPSLWSRAIGELERSYGLRTLYSWTMMSVGEHCVVFEVSPRAKVDEVLRRLSSDPRVSAAQAVAAFRTLAAETYWNDPYAHLQHGAAAMRLHHAHRWATGRGVKVAVVDTGVDFDHPDLRGRVVAARSFVDRGERSFTLDIHGTAVAGVIAAAANNEIGIVGVAPQAEIYALKACWQQPSAGREAVCNSYTLAKAVDFAILNGVHVLNFSLTGPPDELLTRLIRTALDRGIAVVASAPADGSPGFPASLRGVIGIAGLPRTEDAIPSLPGDLLAAPGADILTTVPRGSYDFFSGSSLAAAQVSGIAALLLERSPGLTPAELASLIRETARRPQDRAALRQVDACAALARSTGAGECP